MMGAMRSPCRERRAARRSLTILLVLVTIVSRFPIGGQDLPVILDVIEAVTLIV
jgi:hypothetical protein